jgi:hypothetical protein
VHVTGRVGRLSETIYSVFLRARDVRRDLDEERVDGKRERERERERRRETEMELKE